MARLRRVSHCHGNFIVTKCIRRKWTETIFPRQLKKRPVLFLPSAFWTGKLFCFVFFQHGQIRDWISQKTPIERWSLIVIEWVHISKVKFSLYFLHDVCTVEQLRKTYEGMPSRSFLQLHLVYLEVIQYVSDGYLGIFRQFVYFCQRCARKKRS